MVALAPVVPLCSRGDVGAQDGRVHGEGSGQVVVTLGVGEGQEILQFLVGLEGIRGKLIERADRPSTLCGKQLRDRHARTGAALPASLSALDVLTGITLLSAACLSCKAHWVVRGPSHRCKRCNQGHQRRDSGVSVQVVRTVHEARLLIIRRSWVRAPLVPHNRTSNKDLKYWPYSALDMQPR